MKLLKILSLGILLLTCVLFLEQYSNIDVLVQNYLYNFESHQWIITPDEHNQLSFVFYDGMKRFVATIGTCCVIFMLSSIKIKKFRAYISGALIVLLSTIIVPTLAGYGKKISNVYCPSQTQIYEGSFPYVKIMENYPSSFQQIHKGRCFPAGHATGAFSLMSLFFLFKKRRNKFIGLSLGVVLGWTSGVYQMLRGEHFLSHTLFTMIMALIMICIIDYLVKKIQTKFIHKT